MPADKEARERLVQIIVASEWLLDLYRRAVKERKIIAAQHALAARTGILQALKKRQREREAERKHGRRT
jgi:hypothetical protein